VFVIDAKDKMGKGEKIRLSIDMVSPQVIKPGLPITAMFNYKKPLNIMNHIDSDKCF
jgi:hypothetical protein